jgi:hypothetical protein
MRVDLAYDHKWYISRSGNGVCTLKFPTNGQKEMGSDEMILVSYRIWYLLLERDQGEACDLYH